MTRGQTSNSKVSPIAICTVGELFGGVERHVLAMLEGLKAKGIHATLFLFQDSELATQARLLGVSPVILTSGNLAIFATARKLARYLCERNIKVVHVHGYKATVFCTLARAWCPIALVTTQHGLPESMAGRPFNALRDRVYHWLAGALARYSHACFCYVTEDLRAYYQGSTQDMQSRVIPNGTVNLRPIDFSRPPEYADGCFNLAIVGRLDTVKGHNIAIDALSMPSVPANIHLHIVGTGPCESQLRSITQASSIKDRVHFLGFRRNVYDYLAHCDALLMPSMHEGLPYTLLETMSLGTPIIASHVGGLAEVLQDGVTALLVPPKDAVNLALAIIRLHNDRAMSTRLGRQAQCVQRARYSLDAMTESYLEVYRALTADHI